MNIRIQIRHDAASEGIQKYITEQFGHVCDKYNEEIIKADFRIDHEGPQGHLKKIECVIHVPNDTITVNESSDEIHKAIDTALRVVDRQLQKHKEMYTRPGAQIRHKVGHEQAPTEEV